MKYKYKIDDRVWANIRTPGLKWRRGTIINRHKGKNENKYNITTIHGNFEVAESDIEKL